VVVEINLTRANKSLIYGFYCVPSTNGEYLLELIIKQSLSNGELNSTPVFLSGDLNFPHINWNFQAALGLDNLPNLFCNIISDTYTDESFPKKNPRYSCNIENILHLVFTN